MNKTQSSKSKTKQSEHSLLVSHLKQQIDDIKAAGYLPLDLTILEQKKRKITSQNIDFNFSELMTQLNKNKRTITINQIRPFVIYWAHQMRKVSSKNRTKISAALDMLLKLGKSQYYILQSILDIICNSIEKSMSKESSNSKKIISRLLEQLRVLRRYTMDCLVLMQSAQEQMFRIACLKDDLLNIKHKRINNREKYFQLHENSDGRYWLKHYLNKKGYGPPQQYWMRVIFRLSGNLKRLGDLSFNKKEKNWIYSCLGEDRVQLNEKNPFLGSASFEVCLVRIQRLDNEKLKAFVCDYCDTIIEHLFQTPHFFEYLESEFQLAQTQALNLGLNIDVASSDIQTLLPYLTEIKEETSTDKHAVLFGVLKQANKKKVTFKIKDQLIDLIKNEIRRRAKTVSCFRIDKNQNLIKETIQKLLAMNDFYLCNDGITKSQRVPLLICVQSEIEALKRGQFMSVQALEKALLAVNKNIILFDEIGNKVCEGSIQNNIKKLLEFVLDTNQLKIEAMRGNALTEDGVATHFRWGMGDIQKETYYTNALLLIREILPTNLYAPLNQLKQYIEKEVFILSVNQEHSIQVQRAKNGYTIKTKVNWILNAQTREKIEIMIEKKRCFSESNTAIWPRGINSNSPLLNHMAWSGWGRAGNKLEGLYELIPVDYQKHKIYQGVKDYLSIPHHNQLEHHSQLIKLLQHLQWHQLQAKLAIDKWGANRLLGLIINKVEKLELQLFDQFQNKSITQAQIQSEEGQMALIRSLANPSLALPDLRQWIANQIQILCSQKMDKYITTQMRSFLVHNHDKIEENEAPLLVEFQHSAQEEFSELMRDQILRSQKKEHSISVFDHVQQFQYLEGILSEAESYGVGERAILIAGFRQKIAIIVLDMCTKEWARVANELTTMTIDEQCRLFECADLHINWILMKNIERFETQFPRLVDLLRKRRGNVLKPKLEIVRDIHKMGLLNVQNAFDLVGMLVPLQDDRTQWDISILTKNTMQRSHSNSWEILVKHMEHLALKSLDDWLTVMCNEHELDSVRNLEINDCLTRFPEANTRFKSFLLEEVQVKSEWIVSILNSWRKENNRSGLTDSHIVKNEKSILQYIKTLDDNRWTIAFGSYLKKYSPKILWLNKIMNRTTRRMWLISHLKIHMDDYHQNEDSKEWTYMPISKGKVSQLLQWMIETFSVDEITSKCDKWRWGKAEVSAISNMLCRIQQDPLYGYYTTHDFRDQKEQVTYLGDSYDVLWLNDSIWKKEWNVAHNEGQYASSLFGKMQCVRSRRNGDVLLVKKINKLLIPIETSLKFNAVAQYMRDLNGDVIQEEMKVLERLTAMPASQYLGLKLSTVSQKPSKTNRIVDDQKYEKTLLQIAKRLACYISNKHKQSFYFRDICFKNLYIRQDLNSIKCLLIDYGFSTNTKQSKTPWNWTTNKPPEQLKNRIFDCEKGDVWQYGGTVKELYKMFDKDIPLIIQNIIGECMKKKAQNRPSMQQVVAKFEWVPNIKQKVKKHDANA